MKIIIITILTVLLISGCRTSSSTEKNEERKSVKCQGKLPITAYRRLSGDGDGPLYTAEISEGAVGVVKLEAMPKQGPYIDSLRTELFTHKNPENSFLAREYPMFADFYSKGSVCNVEVMKNRPSLAYKFWRAKRKSPLIILMPGLGAPYTSGTATALAELFHLQGCSVVVISNAMNWLFAQAAVSSIVPGYTPDDAEDVYIALAKIIDDLRERESLRPKKLILAGYSLGAMHTLFVANIDERRKAIGFNRYIAINPPVDLCYGLKQLDSMFATWKKWEHEALVTSGNMEKAQKELCLKIDKVAAEYFYVTRNGFPENAVIPISTEGAKFLIGFSFHMLLREIIYNIHKAYDISVIRTPYRWIARNKMYMEIGHYSYNQYLNKFLLTYYSELWQKKLTIAGLNSKASLTAVERGLCNNNKIRVFHAVDDFLLRDEDLKWLRQTFKKRLTLFDRGGHLGYMSDHYAQQFFLNALTD